ncbi:hypothetical protein TSUD_105200 [Trifolium subterraneum]|uniref:Putative plant transposon protein domain-containing protein n=1 Tax=Trifolium subterraneum TaxID=3900 RepID=A0A2Z6N4S6_TRISU|nr:hypothetical protein TSUD_105200 [Trifolium subterraneum]
MSARKRTRLSTAPPPQFNASKFLGIEHQRRYEKISGFRFTDERAFSFKPSESTEITQELNRRNWDSLNSLIKPSKLTIALEFFANAYRLEQDIETHTTVVRGKTVDFSAEAINNLLGLPTPLECGVQRRRNELIGKSREEYDEILRELCRSGAEWQNVTENGNPTMFRHKDMMPIPKAWGSFLVQTLESCSNSSEFRVQRVVAVQAILHEEEINVGKLISDNLVRMANEKKNTWMFGHCCIINELCKNAGVVIDSSDVDLIPKAVIDQGWMDKCRDTPVDDNERTRKRRQSSSLKEHQVSQRDMQQYLMASLNFMQDVSRNLHLSEPIMDDQSALWQAAQKYRKEHAPSIYERFEGSRESLEQHHKAEMRELKHRQAQELAHFKFEESQHHEKEHQEET